MENILLIFLSPIRINNGFANKTKYENLDGEETETTNESAVRYLLQNYLKNHGDLSKIFIFASKNVRENIAGLQNPVTHLQYFKNRIAKFLPNVETCITEKTIYNYDEDNTDVQNLKTVADMAERIQKFATEVKKNSGKEVCLHVDLTGGMRHINMMMLDVTRLLEYSGIRIGHLIYSNLATKRVEEVKNIYDLFQLISGVEEFVNFGSVEVLNDYYNRHEDKIKLSAGLKKLTVAMKNFAEEIKLCHYGQFRDSVQELHDAINDFSADSENLHDIFMARLIGRVREDYKLLLETRGINDLKIIRWCIAKGYLQQALTLYTERVPEYLGENGFIVQTEKETKKLDAIIDKDSWKRNRWYYLLNVLNYTAENFKGLKIYSGAIKDDAIPKIRARKFDLESWIKNLNEKLDELDMECKDEIKLCEQLELLNKIGNNAEILQSIEKNPELDSIKEIIRELNEELSAEDNVNKRRKKIFSFIQNKIKTEHMKNYFPGLFLSKSLRKKFPYAFRLHDMIYLKVFSSVIDEEKFLTIMEKYFTLRDERNHSNHARTDFGNFRTATELENFMINALDEIEDAQKTLSK